MCGILAVLGCSDNSQAKRARVLELSRRPINIYMLKRRGPDWSGLYQHGDYYIAHQRLAIVDPASGDQPLYNEDKTVIVAHILYRQKEQFSDGVGYSWIDGLKNHAELQVTDKMMLNASHIFPHNTPQTKEAYYYRMIFEQFFPQNPAILTVPGGASVACSTEQAIKWDASWSDHLDPSGRAAFGVHDSAYELNVGRDTGATKIVEDGPIMIETTVPELTIRS